MINKLLKHPNAEISKIAETLKQHFIEISVSFYCIVDSVVVPIVVEREYAFFFKYCRNVSKAYLLHLPPLLNLRSRQLQLLKKRPMDQEHR